MKKRILKPLFIVSILFVGILPSQAQFSVGADFVSRYHWRGQLLASTPAIQPSISYTVESEDVNFEIGAWGSYSFTGNDGSEADLYFSVGFSDFSIGITDYFFPSDTPFAVGDNYFDYDNHVFELNFGYDGPVALAVNYNLTGDAKGIEGGEDEDFHSVYAELGYSFGQTDLSVGLGNGWYRDQELTMDPNGTVMDVSNDFGLVNVALTHSKDIKITEDFALPVFGTVAFNPTIEKIFLVFGMSF